jgi:hydroxymethylpyrimidine pyrophosphatase-like HAD family hydrolase
MEQFKNKILFFADLDDSIFQTKKKDAKGKYKATFPKNILKTSFYTKAQFELLNFILSAEDIVFIPLTARTENQFKRTSIYKKSQAEIYSYYYGSALYINNTFHQPFYKFISKDFLSSFNDLQNIITLTTKRFPEIKFVNVDGKYFTTEFKSTAFINYLQNMINTKYQNIDIYIEEKYITLLPKVCNKKSVVTYLKKILSPKLIIGIGNSVSDIGFLSECDFKIISHIGSLNQKLLNQ